MFGPKKDEVKGDWRKLRNEKLKDVHLMTCTPHPILFGW